MTRALRFIVVAVLLLDASTVLSQSFYAIRRERSVIGYVGVGSANYLGELSNPASLNIVKPSFNLGLEHYLNRRISARVEGYYYQIAGNDKLADNSRIVRNLSFFSNNIELNASGVLNLLPNGRRFYQRQTINFYGFIGIGFTYINPKTTYNGQTIALQPVKTEGVHYSKFQPVIPFGGGMRLKMGPFFNLVVEAGLRRTFTDYLDDVSSATYADPATLGSDLARALNNRSDGKASVRGNPNSVDYYFLMTGKLQYYLPYDLSALKRNKLYTQKRKYYRRR